MRDEPAGDRSPDAAGSARRWGLLVVVAAVATWMLVSLGGVVRITGSGMGCGPEWPLCNGELVPLMDFPTFIEWSHRLAAAVVSLLVAAVALQAWWPGRDTLWRPYRRVVGLAVGLLVVQILLGAVTVWLELPPASVVLHLGTAMALLGVLVVGAVLALSGTRTLRWDAAARGGWGTAAAALVVVLLGALVANLGAAPACRGFPLCNGSVVPGGGWGVQLHWVHRVAAYGLVAWCLWLPFWVRRRRPRDGTSRAFAWATAGVAVVQLSVGAAMVLGGLPMALRVVHMAVGAGLFAMVVALATLLGRPRRDRRAAGVRPAGSAG